MTQNETWHWFIRERQRAVVTQGRVIPSLEKWSRLLNPLLKSNETFGNGLTHHSLSSRDRRT